MGMAAESAHIKYVISTEIGGIPYVPFRSEEQFKIMIKVFADDFIYKNSVYCKGSKLKLAEFISAEQPICLAFKKSLNVKSKKTGRVLNSKRGMYKLLKEEYEKIVKEMDVSLFADYDTGILRIDNKEVIEPENIIEFMECIRKGDKIPGTEFINKLVEENKMILLDGNSLIVKDVSTSCDEYLKYLIKINEINGKRNIAKNNYKQIYEYIKQLN